jgi:hypothetical protein
VKYFPAGTAQADPLERLKEITQKNCDMPDYQRVRRAARGRNSPTGQARGCAAEDYVRIATYADHVSEPSRQLPRLRLWSKPYWSPNDRNRRNGRLEFSQATRLWALNRNSGANSMRRTAFALLASLAGLIAVLFAVRLTTAAPADESVAQRFRPKKADYEQLRDMLVEDKSLRQIAPWGVRTTALPIVQAPPIAELALDRYQKYLVLLSNIEAAGITRSDGADPDICILVWASGWAADTFHVSVCWMADHAPTPTPGTSARFSFFSLGDRWYVERDTQERAR